MIWTFLSDSVWPIRMMSQICGISLEKNFDGRHSAWLILAPDVNAGSVEK